MPISRFIVMICISLISIVLSPITMASHRAGAAILSLGAGYERFSSKRHIDNTGMPFFALGYDLTDNWGVEGFLGLTSTDSRRPEDDGRQIKTTLFTFDGVYHFSPYHKVEPYVLAGVGITGMHPNGRSDANNEGNINAGVGAEIFIAKSIAFRLEARDLY